MAGFYYMEKPSLKVVEKFSKIVGKTYKNEEFFNWVAVALECLQYNIMVVYSLLPEKESSKKIEPVFTIDKEISTGTSTITPSTEGITYTLC